MLLFKNWQVPGTNLLSEVQVNSTQQISDYLVCVQDCSGYYKHNREQAVPCP